MNNPFTPITEKLDAIELLLLKLTNSENSAVNISESLSSDHEQLLNTGELASYLRCSIQTVHNLKAQGYLPYYKLSRIIYFKKSEIDKVAKVDKMALKNKKLSPFNFSNN
jgi:hypothetical protein